MPIPPEKGGELSPGSLASADVESSRASKMFTVLGKMAPEAGRAGGVRDGLGLEAPQLPGGALWSGASSWGASEACMGRLPQLPTLPASFLPPTTHPSLYFTPQQKALVVGKTWGGAVLTLTALVPVWRVGAVWPPTPQLSAESFPWTCPQLERGPHPTPQPGLPGAAASRAWPAPGDQGQAASSQLGQLSMVAALRGSQEGPAEVPVAAGLQGSPRPPTCTRSSVAPGPQR